MFKSIKLKNFQSHIDSTIDFEPGINVITGTSDHGKSSIIRAFKWALFNKPFRDSGLRNENVTEKEGVSVTIVTDTDISIERYKTDKQNGYKVSTYPDVFKAIDKDVPTEVQEILKVSDVNLQEQHNPYFLLNDRPGTVAATFNEMIGLSAMDACVSAAKKKVKQKKDILDSATAELERINNELDTVVDVTSIEQKLFLIKEYTKELNALYIKSDFITNIIDEYKECDALIYTISPSIKKFTQLVSDLDKAYKRVQLVNTKNKAIQSILDEYNLIDSKIKVFSNYAPNIDINLLENMYNDINVLQNKYNLMDSTEITYKDIFTSLNEVLKIIKVHENEYSVFISSYSNCPLCNSILKK